MKRVTLSSLSLVCLLASGMGASALAQSAAGAPSAAAPGVTKIAVINFQAAVAQTNEGQRNFGELQKKFDPKRTQLKTLQDEIDNLKKQLQTQSASLSDAERANRLKVIDDKEKEYQRTGEDASNDFQSEMQQTYQQLAEKVFGTLTGYAEQNGYSLVLDASAAPQQGVPTVLWASKTTDITAAVIQAYNAKSGIPAPPASSSVPSAPAPTHTTPRSSGTAAPKQ
jgi:outer membrane protein